MARIGIFGYYRCQNFGDDLMALMLARHVARCGHEALILGGGGDELSGAATCFDSAREFALASDCVILGGGAYLSDFNAQKCSDDQRQMDSDCFEIVRVARTHEIPTLAVSIGGSSRGKSRGVRTGCMTYFLSDQLRGITTRLGCDVPFLQNMLSAARAEPPPVETYPDIVLSMPDAFLNEAESPDARGRRGALTVGVNVSQYRLARRLVRGLHLLFGRSRAVRVVYTHNSPSERDRFISGYPMTRGSEHFAAESPGPMLAHLRGCDLVIGYRLHLGFAALSLGVPYLAFTPMDKTRLALSELGWSGLEQVRRTRELPALFWAIRRAAGGKHTKLLDIPDNLDSIRQAASGHFDWLRDQLQSAVGVTSDVVAATGCNDTSEEAVSKRGQAPQR
jgi:hypothetical protein